LLLRRSSSVALSGKGHLEADALGIEEFIEGALPRQYGAAGAQRLDPLYRSRGVKVIDQHAEVIDLGRLSRRRVIENDPGFAGQENRLRGGRTALRLDRISKQLPVEFCRSRAI